MGKTPDNAFQERRSLLGRNFLHPEVQHALESFRPGEMLTLCPNVPASAWGFTLSLLSEKFPQRIWVICASPRQQENLYTDLQNWMDAPLFIPELEMAASENSIPDAEISSERLEALQVLHSGTSPQVILTTSSCLDSYVPTPQHLLHISRLIRKNSALPIDEFMHQLEQAGYERVPQVSHRGQYAVRGGILDVYSWQNPLPIRIELFDTEIDSIREFDLDQQISVRHLKECSILLGDPDAEMVLLETAIQPGDLVITFDPDIEKAHLHITNEPIFQEETADLPTLPLDFSLTGLDGLQSGDVILESAARQRLFDQLDFWQKEKWQVSILCNNEGEQDRLKELFQEQNQDFSSIEFLLGTSNQGFLLENSRLVLLSDALIFGRYRQIPGRRLEKRREKLLVSRSQIDFSDLRDDELVVHADYGIGRYCGIHEVPGANEVAQSVLELEFADRAKVYVPMENAYLVSRYVGVGKKSPPLSKLGEKKWGNAKRKAQAAIMDYASQLLTLHAERETTNGYAFRPDTHWQREFESSFLYRETPDQLQAILDTKQDMESTQPMDRLICGDVGFGKTEVAIRAAFKAVMDGKQVAVLVPTTVLAQQHYQNFRERMSDYPIRVELLSRFRTPAEQARTLQELQEGSVDMVIGTHRLVSPDVQFKDLGLVVIDEEQRFGVLHKEKFKERFRLVDVLTLSATPIPRTLYLSLLGARDMSVIETPPTNRLPVETIIAPYNTKVIHDAIQRELQRDGQVFFLHNRVQSIQHVRNNLQKLCPEARIEVGHGQMPEHQLEEVMSRFIAGEIDVLVSTTIIESGIDIPNANTIIIDRADRFGLADLYQLRGRVGRAQHKAYAYLLLPQDMVFGEAKKRLTAMKQYSSLGAGFKIAMRDLEIRGAGNILGTEQSGHIFTVGFDLYCKLLRQAIQQLTGKRKHSQIEVITNFDFVVTSEPLWLEKQSFLDCPAFIPVSYIEEPLVRIKAYRKLAETESQRDIEQLRKEWKDRFGPLPRPAENILLLHSIRIAASQKKLSRVETREHRLMLTRGKDYIMLNGKFPRLTAEKPDLNFRQVLDLIRKL